MPTTSSRSFDVAELGGDNRVRMTRRRRESQRAHPLPESEPDPGVERAHRAASRRGRDAPSDAEIERGLRERAVNDPRAAEILLRWLQRTRVEERVGGADLDSMSVRELERLYVGRVKLATCRTRNCGRWLITCSQARRTGNSEASGAARSAPSSSAVERKAGSRALAAHLSITTRLAIPDG